MVDVKSKTKARPKRAKAKPAKSKSAPAKAKFPSVAWFNAVRKIFNNEEAYRGAGGGRCNCVCGIRVGKQNFILTFEGLECISAAEGDNKALEDVDFYLDMPTRDWQAMVRDIAKSNGATLDYTLNTLDLDREEGLSHSKHNDQYREDLFFRYNQTFQFFFDASARITTSF